MSKKNYFKKKKKKKKKKGGETFSFLTAIAQLVVPQIEHCTLSAPLGYISTTRHCGDEQTSWAMSRCCWSVEAEPPPAAPAPAPAAEGDEGPPPALPAPALVM